MTYQVDILFRKYAEPLKIHAYRKLNNIEDAEDAVMSAFAKIVQYADTIQHVEEIKPYLTQVVNNEISAILKRRAIDLESPDFYYNETVTPDDEVIQSETQLIVDSALDLVEPRHHREAAILYYRHDLGYSTISKMLNISYHQAVSYIRQATDKVGRILRKQEINYE